MPLLSFLTWLGCTGRLKAMTIHMIWAASNDGFIGKGNNIPWNVPEDMQNFKSLTEGRTVVMGRKTWESLGSKPLPNRTNIVLSKQYGYIHKFSYLGIKVYDSAISAMKFNPSLWVIGGLDVYMQFMPYADHIVKTEVDVNVNGGTRSPGMFPPDWREVSNTGDLMSRTGINYRIREYVRND